MANIAEGEVKGGDLAVTMHDMLARAIRRQAKIDGLPESLTTYALERARDGLNRYGPTTFLAHCELSWLRETIEEATDLWVMSGPMAVLRGDGNGGAGLGQLQEAVRDLDQRVHAMNTLLKTRPCVLELPCPPVAVEERIGKVAEGGN